MTGNDAFPRARGILALSTVLLAPLCGSLALGCSRPITAPPSAASVVTAPPCAPTATAPSLEASTIGGFGAPLETLFLDGNRATLVVHETDDVGLAVGAFGASGAARATPVAAVRLELAPPQAAEGGERYVVRVVNIGTASITVTLPEGGPWLEASDLPLDNASWSPLGPKAAALAPTALAPSASIELPILAPHRGTKPFALVARFSGKIELSGAPHLEGAFFTRLASGLVEVGVHAR